MIIINTSDYSLISELCDALKDATEPTSLLVGDQVVIVTPAESITVYVVWFHQTFCADGVAGIVGVFSTLEKAEAARAEDSDYMIEELTLDVKN